MAKGLLFRGQKNGGYCNIHKGINFNNSAKGSSCVSGFIRKQHTQKTEGVGEERRGVVGEKKEANAPRSSHDSRPSPHPS